MNSYKVPVRFKHGSSGRGAAETKAQGSCPQGAYVLTRDQRASRHTNHQHVASDKSYEETKTE